jgi:hypothetical protein
MLWPCMCVPSGRTGRAQLLAWLVRVPAASRCINQWLYAHWLASTHMEFVRRFQGKGKVEDLSAGIS